MIHRRSFGNGRLDKEARSNGEQWIASWTDAQGRRRRRALSTDKRVAERALAKIIRDRDLLVLGLADEEQQDLPFAEVCARYLTDLATRVVPRHLARITGVLNVSVRQSRLLSMATSVRP